MHVTVYTETIAKTPTNSMYSCCHRGCFILDVQLPVLLQLMCNNNNFTNFNKIFHIQQNTNFTQLFCINQENTTNDLSKNMPVCNCDIRYVFITTYVNTAARGHPAIVQVNQTTIRHAADNMLLERMCKYFKTFDDTQQLCGDCRISAQMKKHLWVTRTH